MSGETELMMERWFRFFDELLGFSRSANVFDFTVPLGAFMSPRVELVPGGEMWGDGDAYVAV